MLTIAATGRHDVGALAKRLTYPVVRAWLLDEVKKDRGHDLAARASERFESTRQAIGRHLKKLVADGVLVASGRTRNRSYRFAVMGRVSQDYPTAGLQEHEVWAQDIAPILNGVGKNVLEICEYGVTEILNNAIDHSGAERVHVSVKRTAVEIKVSVEDHGIGIFRKIRDAQNLESDRQAILELTKGKVTTDPSRHTGEGIFFTSRMMDVFVILSAALSLVHNRTADDWLFEDRSEVTRGTLVAMSIEPASDHTVQEVFDRYTATQDDYAFARTQVVLALAETEGGSLVSRSQAKRVMVGLERFREACLNFKGVPSIGPAFADEIFRVWKSAHPGTVIFSESASPEVARMIARSETASRLDKLPTDR